MLFANPVLRLLSIVSACFIIGSSTAPAASVADSDKPRKAAPQVLAGAVEVTAGIAGMGPSSDAEAVCTKVRRRLWVEGEGWVVRRVGHCR